MNALDSLISALCDVCAGLPDRRIGPHSDAQYSMADIGLSVFFVGSPSFLGHQRALQEGHGRSNCQTLFEMTAIPTDPYIHLMLDGTEHFSSRKIHCARCSTRKRADGGIEHFHAFLGASIVAPGRQLPLPPEFIAPQDGAEKQDRECYAVKRWLALHGPTMRCYRPICLGDDLFACQPIASEVQKTGGAFIFTCKPGRIRPLPNTSTALNSRHIALAWLSVAVTPTEPGRPGSMSLMRFHWSSRRA